MKKMNIIRLICLSCFMYMASSAASAQEIIAFKLIRSFFGGNLEIYRSGL